MTAKPSRQTTDGSVYLALRALAQDSRRPTDELHQLYALEGFLHRLQRSTHASSLVLKGGVLLAAFDARRPTRDIDFAATGLTGDLPDLLALTNDVLGIATDDGLIFDTAATQIAASREGDPYPGARAKIAGSLSTARIRFHIDFNVGDPLWPEPEQVQLPRLLGGESIQLTGYRLELVIAEKVVTAVQRGTANTRWRDFVDIASLSAVPYDSDALRQSIRRVAAHRQVSMQPLAVTLNGFADLAQVQWAAWRRKQQLNDTPENFSELLDQVTAFSDPFLVN